MANNLRDGTFRLTSSLDPCNELAAERMEVNKASASAFSTFEGGRSRAYRQTTRLHMLIAEGGLQL